ncbi:EF hand [Acinetobacter marinus]|uniref:EF hand n=1 Tax=Acinetobacter marinus TaxID=281375 RepID=A0A1G6JGN2_9GAMM|nr:EF-hand domain-containing protein [Acinetobacter marinus]SDC17823.1 EF hand [Acinetobacter marinus]
MKKQLITPLLVSLVFVSTMSSAETAYVGEAPQKNLTQSDKESFMQRIITLQIEAIKKSFSAADVNHDGKLSKSEIEKANPDVAKKFTAFDTDQDGFLTIEEIFAGLKLLDTSK